METVYIIEDAIRCAAGPICGGWFAAALCIEDADAEHLAELQRLHIRFKEGRSEREWSDAVANAPRRLVLAVENGSGPARRVLSGAERIEGPDTASGETPTVVWSERKHGRWSLKLLANDRVTTIHETDTMLIAPAAARGAEGTYVACHTQTSGEPTTTVWDEQGRRALSCAGRNPRLAGSPEAGAMMLVERSQGEDLQLFAVWVDGPRKGEETPIPSEDDYSLNASLACGPDGGFYAAFESCPAFGMDERLGLHRDINVCALRQGERAFAAVAGCDGTKIPVEPKAFTDQSDQNRPPGMPVVFLHDGEPAVAFRRFRHRGAKAFGWDTWLTLLRGGQWSEARRVSPSCGPGDAPHGMVSLDDRLLAFLPSCDHQPIRVIGEDRETPPKRSTQPAKRFRVEVNALSPDEALPDPSDGHDEAPYVIAHSAKEISPPPPALPSPPDGMRLVWADLHAHSAYSKCMSANDGQPADVLRFERDVLGCDVLCLTEHVEYMTAPEFAHVLDRLEAEAGDGHVPLYGVEWARKPAHHTNIFAANRLVFDRLRALMLAEGHLTPLYKRIKEELPPGSVTAIRHFHGFGEGPHGTAGERVAETHDPEMERAMEAMQTRGNMMLPRSARKRLFPHPFLKAGARLGLVGGSDHSRGNGPNRFCLTGLWVPELTGERVMEAIRERRTVACSNARIALHATLNGQPMGSAVNVQGGVTLRLQATSARPLRRASLMRDGEALEWVELGGTQAEVEISDPQPRQAERWYGVTVEADSAYEGLPAVAHASPFFVARG